MSVFFSGQPEQKGSASRIYSLFQQAVDLSDKERERFLEDLRSRSESEYREVKSLIEGDDSPNILPVPEPQPSTLKPGDFLGRYEILEFIDQGGMGEVYKVSHPELGVMALKILSRELAENTAFIARLRREAKTASALRHANIVTIHDFYQQGYLTYMVMEFVDGQALRKMIGKLSLYDAIKHAVQMAEALNFAHSNGIIHRDIKPENVMVGPDGNIKILDFGLAKPVHRSPETAKAGARRFDPTGINTDPHVLMGTLRYMAPEQLDRREATGQSDVWSWGVVFYEMLANRRPFEASTDFEVEEAIRKREPGPPSRYRDLNRIVLKAIRKKPEERYRLMAEAVADLEKFRTPSWLMRIALVLGMALVLIAGYLANQWTKNPRLQAVGQLVRLEDEGHATLPAISPAKTHLLYTENYGGESVLRLVDLDPNLSHSNDKIIARSLDGKFMGAAFAPNDDQTIYFLLQDRVLGTGILYRLQLSTAGKVMGALNPVANDVLSPGSATVILRDFSQDKSACENNWNVASLAWYHRTTGSGRFESVCQNPPGQQDAANAASMDSPPSFSPDGKHFVFFSVDGKTNTADLIVGGTEGGEETLIGQRYSPFLYPMWSPDGTEILTATWISSDTTLWLTILENGKPVGKPKSYHLDNLIFKGKPAWLNNGRSIAVSAVTIGTSNAQIHQIPLDGSRPENLLPSENDYGDLDSITCPQGFFRPNCQQALIAVRVEDSSSVWVERLGENKPALINGPGKFTGIVWKDADRLISESENGGNPDLLLMNANEGHRSPVSVWIWITKDDKWERDPVVSPDGRYLVYASNQEGGVHLWRLDLHDLNAKPIRLTFSGSMENQPSISPDSQWVIYTSIAGRFQTLWQIPINGGKAKQITNQPARNASVSSKGDIVCEYLFEVSPGVRKWIIAILDGNGQVKYPFDIPIRTPVKWSKNGDGILYVKGQNGIENVWEKPIHGGGADAQVTHFNEERVFAFALSPDGNRVACLCGHEKYSQIVQIQLAK